jgi:hypothetical protein
MPTSFEDVVQIQVQLLVDTTAQAVGSIRPVGRWCVDWHQRCERVSEVVVDRAVGGPAACARQKEYAGYEVKDRDHPAKRSTTAAHGGR